MDHGDQVDPGSEVTELVVISREDLRDTINTAVQQALQEWRSTDSPWMSVAEAAEYLRVSEYTVRVRVKAGEIPSSRVGDRVVLHRRELDRWLGVC